MDLHSSPRWFCRKSSPPARTIVEPDRWRSEILSSAAMTLVANDRQSGAKVSAKWLGADGEFLMIQRSGPPHSSLYIAMPLTNFLSSSSPRSVALQVTLGMIRSSWSMGDLIQVIVDKVFRARTPVSFNSTLQ